jgi:hypothetical protein
MEVSLCGTRMNYTVLPKKSADKEKERPLMSASETFQKDTADQNDPYKKFAKSDV